MLELQAEGVAALSISDYELLRNFVALVANSPDSNMNEINWRALRADARDQLRMTAPALGGDEPVWGPFVADDLPGGGQ